jgi:pyrroline-5-carboxylate reductase
MENRSVGFLGGGRITRILLAGWARAQHVPEEVVVSDVDEECLRRLRSVCPTARAVGNDKQQAASQDIVFLAVHPPVIGEVLGEVAQNLKRETILVSLAPKWTIDKLSEGLQGFRRIARMIPNAPSLVGKGFNPIAYDPSLTPEDRGDLAHLLKDLGELPEVAEEKLEVYAILTAMGPTYLWPQLYELQSLAESFGLSREEASTGLLAMVTGSLEAMAASEFTPEEIQDLIPVKPLAELEPTILDAYRTKLSGLLQKIRP